MKRCKLTIGYKLLQDLLELPYPIVCVADDNGSGGITIVMEGGDYEVVPCTDVPFIDYEKADSLYARWRERIKRDF